MTELLFLCWYLELPWLLLSRRACSLTTNEGSKKAGEEQAGNPAATRLCFATATADWIITDDRVLVLCFAVLGTKHLVHTGQVLYCYAMSPAQPSHRSSGIAM